VHSLNQEWKQPCHIPKATWLLTIEKTSYHSLLGIVLSIASPVAALWTLKKNWPLLVSHLDCTIYTCVACWDIFGALSLKQDENHITRSMVSSEQMSRATVLQPSFRHHHVSQQKPVSSQKPIDLSCHEMDVDVDSGPTPASQRCVDADMADSQGNRNFCCFES